jgi:hypothetical protein
MSPQVEVILRQIDALDDASRLVLEQKLEERAKAEWQREAGTARAIAHQRGIDQRRIDDAVEGLRYGS